MHALQAESVGHSSPGRLPLSAGPRNCAVLSLGRTYESLRRGLLFSHEADRGSCKNGEWPGEPACLHRDWSRAGKAPWAGPHGLAPWNRRQNHMPQQAQQSCSECLSSYLWWRPSQTARSFYSSRSSGAQYPHPPGILLFLRALGQGEGLAGLGITLKESRMN